VKYKLTETTKRYGGSHVRRIVAAKDFVLQNGKTVKAGSLGGWVEGEHNLSQDGKCWIDDDAMVLMNASVSDDVYVFHNAVIYNDAKIRDGAIVCDNAEVFQNANVYGNAQILGDSRVYGSAEIHGNAQITDRARCYQQAWVYGDIFVTGNANITDKTTLSPVTLQGLRYTVTIMDAHISFDCESHSVQDWRKMTTRDIIAMDGKEAAAFDKQYRPMITSILESVRPNYKGNV
jgi:carbonic anhydrase/acetyltransferase-like protein (isoleucine patch superfamily)